MNKKDIADIYPLSPTQQGILFQSLSDRGTGIHVEQLVAQVQGQVDRSAFEAAWEAVLDRHAVLRTGFVWKSVSEPLQVVFKHAGLPLAWEDWQDLPPDKQESRLHAYLLADRQRGFDLSRPPLVRLALFQVGPERYQLIWSHNHILMDGWCGPVLIREFLALYQAYRSSRILDLPIGQPYKDYIKWLKARDASQAEAFWRAQLSGFSGPTPLGMPAEPLPESKQVERYGDRRAAFQEETTSRLRAAAQERRLTLNTLIQGAWALLLARYAAASEGVGAADVVFGTTVSGRPPDLPGSEATIGLFINTLPVRAQVDPEAGLWDWLAGLQAARFELAQYEYTPGPLVHRWSGLPGSLPLYESLLVFENYPLEMPDFSASGLSIDLTTARSEGARTGFPLTLLVVESAGLGFQLVHDLRRIAEEDAGRVLEHLQAVLGAFAASGEPTLGEILGRIPINEAPLFRSLPARARLAAGTGYSPPRSQLEAHLAAIWAEILGVERVGVFDSFFELGGHSLLAIQLYYAVREAYPVDLPLLSLFEEPNVARLAQAIEAASRGERGTLPAGPHRDLAAEAVLDPAIVPRTNGRPLPADPERLFLTGATGFLGAYLLHELLDQTRAEILCLVRAQSPEDGLLRLQRGLESHGLWHPEDASRIVPLPGDLARPRLGLSEAQFEALSGSVDAIYHNGAWVTYIFPYPALKPANVLGTQEVLRLACLRGAVPVHYVSSLAVFPLALGRDAIPVRETDSPGDWQALFGGYAQSKWVAERLAAEASRRGLPLTIYRPGLVTGHSRTGAGSTDDMLALLVKGCIQLGALPQIDTRLDMTPVDYVSRALVYLSRKSGVAGQVYHLANPHPAHWSEVAAWIRDYGYVLESLPYEDWRASLDGPDGPRADNALYPLLPLLSERTSSGKALLAEARMPLYRSDLTLDQLEGNGLACPPLDRALVHTYLDHFVRTGFIEAPESARLAASR